MSDDLLTGPQLADLFGCEPRVVQGLAARGIIIRTSRGRYARDESVRRYVKHLREVSAGRGGENHGANLAAERTRLAKEQAEAVSIKNRLARAELVDAKAVAKRWDAAMAGVRAAMLAIPTGITQALPHLTRHDTQAIDRAIRDALTEAADGVDALDGTTQPQAIAHNGSEPTK